MAGFIKKYVYLERTHGLILEASPFKIYVLR